MRYSQEFIDNLVARILSKELRISEASVQYSIGKSTIRYWLEKAKEKSDCVTLPNTGISKPMADLKLPKGVTYLQAHTAVNAKAFLSGLTSVNTAVNTAISHPLWTPGPNGSANTRMP